MELLEPQLRRTGASDPVLRRGVSPTGLAWSTGADHDQRGKGSPPLASAIEDSPSKLMPSHGECPCLSTCLCCPPACVSHLGRKLPVSATALQLLIVWVTLVILLVQRFSLASASFPIFDLQFRWTRMDQAVFLAGAFLGGMGTPLLGTLIGRQYNTVRPSMGVALLIVAAMNWLFRYSWSSFYDMWMNRMLTATMEGFAEGIIFTILWRWVPAQGLAPAVVLAWSAVGAAMVMQESTAVYVFGGTGNFAALFALQAIVCLLAAFVWLSPLVELPDRSQLLGLEEQQSILATAGFRAAPKLRLGEWKLTTMAAVGNVRMWSVWVGAFVYGWLLGPFLCFNGAYFMELVTLRMVISHLPGPSRYPWLLWTLVAVLVSSILVVLTKQAVSLQKRRRLLVIVEAIGVMIAIVSLRSIGDYHSLPTTLSKYCSMVIGAALASSCFFAKVALPRGLHKELPLEVTSVLATVIAAGSVAAYLSVMLSGNILEMAGSWSTVFTYQYRLLLVYLVMEFGVPLLGTGLRWMLRKNLGNGAVLLV